MSRRKTVENDVNTEEANDKVPSLGAIVEGILSLEQALQCHPATTELEKAASRLGSARNHINILISRQEIDAQADIQVEAETNE